jgi:short-subunit dehydrogenase
VLDARVDLTCFAGDITEGDAQLEIFKYASLHSIDTVFISVGVYSDLQASYIHIDKQLDLTKATMRIINGILTRRPKQIVHINSISGKNYCPQEPLYAAGKAALASYMKNIRPYALRGGTRILDVFLGGVDTKMTAGKKYTGKLMSPADVADAILSLPLGSPTLQFEEITLGRVIYE